MHYVCDATVVWTQRYYWTNFFIKISFRIVEVMHNRCFKVWLLTNSHL
jgi:hypothetical protein